MGISEYDDIWEYGGKGTNIFSLNHLFECDRDTNS